MRVVEIKGRDSSDFLHRVTAGAVKPVAAGAGRAGLLLSGQSQLIAQFDLLRVEAERFLLAAPTACAQALADGLEAMHFSESLEISLSPITAGAREAPAAIRPEAENFLFRVSGSELSWPSAVPGFEFSTAASGFPAGWNFERIAALVPWPPDDWSAGTKALEAGMLPWIDREKGCYPGQEVVELSLNVGHPVRILVAVAGNDSMAVGSTIPWGSGAAQVCSAAQRGGETRALVRLPWAVREFLPPGFRRLRSHW